MWKLNEVVGIKYVAKYTYHIVFYDGESGDIAPGTLYARLEELS